MITVDAIKDHAKRLGFDLCGIAPATALPELTRLREWLDRGYAGEMMYLHKSADVRADIRNFLPTARSVIVTGTVYYTDNGGTKVPPSEHGGTKVPPSTAQIARYARGEDYHLVLAERLEALVTWIREAHSESFDAAIFVDKHHVQERVFAKHAGLGWIGKNTCLINADVGSWLFLAGVAVSLDLAPDAPAPDQCGACTLCLDACPTGALVNEYELDATKCISYLTIELHGAIPEEQRAGIGDHVFGCDVCQDVCPWNLAPLATLDPAWQPRAGRAQTNASALWQRSDFELHNLVEGSAMTRTTLSRLRRNLAVVLGNSNDPRAAAVLDRPGGGKRRAAQSAETPLVEEHIGWAKGRLHAKSISA
jgi:epoxyqueuosine reductase